MAFMAGAINEQVKDFYVDILLNFYLETNKRITK